jgi:hypothetical protein
MDKNNNNFNIIFNNYTTIDESKNKILYNIKKVENIYQTYINSKQIDSVNYSIYIDDIEHQVNITYIEYNYICNINLNNKIKLYRDLFKLYLRINKILLNTYIENKVMVVQIWNTNNIFQNETNNFRTIKKIIKKISEKYNGISEENKIFDSIKKYNYSLINIYNELEEDKITFDIIKNLYKELCNRIYELKLTTELIQINLTDISIKTTCGIAGQAYITDLNGKINKINTDYDIIVNLLSSIFEIHSKLSLKYNNMAASIFNDINYEDKFSILNEDESINLNKLKTSSQDLSKSRPRTVSTVSTSSENLNKSRLRTDSINSENLNKSIASNATIIIKNENENENEFNSFNLIQSNTNINTNTKYSIKNNSDINNEEVNEYNVITEINNNEISSDI